MKDVRISDHGNWRHIHWNALVAAYRNSPFFEYYADAVSYTHLQKIIRTGGAEVQDFSPPFLFSFQIFVPYPAIQAFYNSGNYL